MSIGHTDVIFIHHMTSTGQTESRRWLAFFSRLLAFLLFLVLHYPVQVIHSFDSMNYEFSAYRPQSVITAVGRL